MVEVISDIKLSYFSEEKYISLSCKIKLTRFFVPIFIFYLKQLPLVLINRKNYEQIQLIFYLTKTKKNNWLLKCSHPTQASLTKLQPPWHRFNLLDTATASLTPLQPPWHHFNLLVIDTASLTPPKPPWYCYNLLDTTTTSLTSL